MPKVAVIMGSKSDLPVMQEAIDVLKSFGIEVVSKVVSAHRTPSLMYEFAREAEKNGIEVIIAAAGGAAHLPGMTASLTSLPVIGVPIQTKALAGVDSLYSIVQMPYGIPVATVAIGGAKNAALLAIRILSIKHEELRERHKTFMKTQTEDILKDPL